MWPFKKPVDVSDVMEELENVKRQQRGLKSDLDDLWDRFRRLQGRLAKREKSDDTLTADSPTGESSEASTSPLSPTFDRLTPRQKQVQMSVLRRRAGNGAT